MEYYSAVKKEEEEEEEEGNLTLCNSMGRAGEHAKCNKPVRERQIPYAFTHMWNLMNKPN